jgi:hypothetical protein
MFLVKDESDLYKAFTQSAKKNNCEIAPDVHGHLAFERKNIYGTTIIQDECTLLTNQPLQAEIELGKILEENEREDYVFLSLSPPKEERDPLDEYLCSNINDFWIYRLEPTADIKVYTYVYIPNAAPVLQFCIRVSLA